MPKKYDAIIIGAGLGGLSTATMLARKGLSVLLLERHNIPGGFATSFVRGRFEFEVALHEMSGIGPPEDRGSLYRYLDYLGVADNVNFLNISNLYRSVYPDIDITLPAGRQAFEATLCEAFPHEAVGILRFSGRMFDLRKDFIKIARQRGTGNPITMPVRLPHFFRYVPATWGQVLTRDVHDQRARAVISQYWGYVGMPPEQVSFLYFASTLASFIRRGPAFPTGRSQALSSAFLETFEQLGGEVRLNCGVQTINVNAGAVTGVVTESGETINADWIVSNADPLNTCKKMINPDLVPSSFFRELQSSELAASTVNVYLGVACPLERFGLNEHEIFINQDYDTDRHYKVMRTTDAPLAIAVTCYNAVYPDISPPGTSIVVLTALAFAEPWYKIPPSEYVDTKNRIADSMIRMTEHVAPGLRQFIEVVEVSTPLTNIRYADTLGGSIYGFNQPPRDNMVWRMGHRGPLNGLYFAGAWTQPGGGFEPAIMSGQMAGASILRRIKKMSKEAAGGR